MSIEHSRLYKKHKKCATRIDIGPFGPHYARLVCVRHDRTIQWLSKEAATALLEMYRDDI